MRGIAIVIMLIWSNPALGVEFYDNTPCKIAATVMDANPVDQGDVTQLFVYMEITLNAHEDERAAHGLPPIPDSARAVLEALAISYCRKEPSSTIGRELRSAIDGYEAALRMMR